MVDYTARKRTFLESAVRLVRLKRRLLAHGVLTQDYTPFLGDPVHLKGVQPSESRSSVLDGGGLRVYQFFIGVNPEVDLRNAQFQRIGHYVSYAIGALTADTARELEERILADLGVDRG